ncbi:MAG: hypothetical protein JXM71_11625, partial [Spirochaetales bacterium]|nr:hypothetical protein [Spirochaetales bacterium]
MEYRRTRAIASAAVWFVLATVFAAFVFVAGAGIGIVGTAIAVAAAFLVAFAARRWLFASIDERIRQ